MHRGRKGRATRCLRVRAGSGNSVGAEWTFSQTEVWPDDPFGGRMEFGVFIPIANNGWITSTTSPHYMPTFELNSRICQEAEKYGFGFALSMIKLRGSGGVTEHWDYALESFTLMAGIAAVTEKIKLYATVSTLTIPPAILARMAVTIDDIAP